jgi:hypothetical protein
MTRRTFILTIERDDDGLVMPRLRILLKALLRRLGWRCLSIEERHDD